MRNKLALPATLVAALGLTMAATAGPAAGDPQPGRAEKAQTARRRTGAEIQERALNRVIRTSYLCNNGERLTVDFDNPRQMATVRSWLSVLS